MTQPVISAGIYGYLKALDVKRTFLLCFQTEKRWYLSAVQNYKFHFFCLCPTLGQQKAVPRDSLSWRGRTEPRACIRWNRRALLHLLGRNDLSEMFAWRHRLGGGYSRVLYAEASLCAECKYDQHRIMLQMRWRQHERRRSEVVFNLIRRDPPQVGGCLMSLDSLWFEETQEACVWLVKKLRKELGISAENVLRHYDIVNKVCPAPYVHNNKYRTSWTWSEFKRRISDTSDSDDTKQNAGSNKTDGASNTSQKMRYVVQCGAFAEKKNAEAMVRQLQEKGFTAIVKTA